MQKNHSTITAVALSALLGGGVFAQQALAEGYGEEKKTHQTQQQREEQTQQQRDQQTEMQQRAEQGQREQARQQQNARSQRLRQDSVQLSALERQAVEDLQRALQERGYYDGEIDGIVGPKTRNALRRFYSDQAQLASRGMIHPDGAQAFGMDASEVEPVRGEEQEAPQEPERLIGEDEEM